MGEIVPIAIFVILPVAVVLISCVAKHKDLSKKVELAKVAIEHGGSGQIDFSFLEGDKKKKSVKSSLLNRLTWGAVCTLSGIVAIVMFIVNDLGVWWTISASVCLAVGIGFIVAFFIGRKMFAHEMEQEERYAEAELEMKKKKYTFRTPGAEGTPKTE